MIACVIIAGGNRTALVQEQVLPPVVAEQFDEVVVVGRHEPGDGYRYLHVPDLTRTTNDALVKRDVGTLACRSDVIVYLSDDHTVARGFAAELRRLIREAVAEWDVLVPARYSTHPEQGVIRIPNGERERYCAGHGGVFRRRVIMDRPWTAQRHHRNWDVIASQDQQQAGFRFLTYPKLGIIDLEPERTPWL